MNAGPVWCPDALPSPVHDVLKLEAHDMFWFVCRSYRENAPAYAKLPVATVESMHVDDWITDLAQRLLPHPNDCASAWYRDVFRSAEAVEGVAIESALEALRHLNLSLRQRFFLSLRLARSRSSPTPFSDALTFMQRVQRHPRYWEHPLNLLLGVFPEPSPGGFTTDAFLKLVRGHSTDEQAHLRAGLSALSTPARGLLCRALSVFHGVFLRHPDYPVLFSVALQEMLRCATDLERSALVSMFLDHEPDQRMELVLKAL